MDIAGAGACVLAFDGVLFCISSELIYFLTAVRNKAKADRLPI